MIRLSYVPGPFGEECRVIRIGEEDMTNEELESNIRAAVERYNNLPRHEQLRLLHAQKIGWVLGALNLQHTAENSAAVSGVIQAIADERKPKSLGGDK
jgi:hypothetical protein